MSEHPILTAVMAELDVGPDAFRLHGHTKAAKGARYMAAYRLVTETDLPLVEIAAMLGYSQWSGVNHAVAVYCKSIGKPVCNATELRDGVPPRAVDWKRLGELLRANYKAGDFRKAGVSRMVWIKLMRGQRVNVDDFLFALRRLGYSIEAVATPEYLAIKRPS